LDGLIVAKKDLQQLKRNRMAIFLSLVLLPGFFMATLVASEGSSQEMGTQSKFLGVAVADEDNSFESRSFEQALAESEKLGKVVDTSSRETGELLLRSGTVAAVVVVQKGFGSSVEQGSMTSVLLIADDSKPGIPENAYAAIAEIAQGYSASVNLQRSGQPPESLLGVIERGKPISMLEIGVGIILGFVQVFACFYEVAGGMIRERETGTYPRLVLAKASPLAIIVGKTMYSSLLTLTRGVVVLAIAIYGYGAVVYGNVAVVIFVSWIMGLSAMGLAALLSAFRVSGRAVVISEFLLIIVLFAFGGLIRDRDLMTGSALFVSDLLPWTYGFDALRKIILLGWNLVEVLPELTLLSLYTLGFYLAAIFVFQRRYESLLS